MIERMCEQSLFRTYF